MSTAAELARAVEAALALVSRQPGHHITLGMRRIAGMAKFDPPLPGEQHQFVGEDDRRRPDGADSPVRGG